MIKMLLQEEAPRHQVLLLMLMSAQRASIVSTAVRMAEESKESKTLQHGRKAGTMAALGEGARARTGKEIAGIGRKPGEAGAGAGAGAGGAVEGMSGAAAEVTRHPPPLLWCS